MEAISFNSIPEGKLDEVIAERFTQPEEQQTYKDITFNDLENIIPPSEIIDEQPDLIMERAEDEDAKHILQDLSEVELFSLIKAAKIFYKHNINPTSKLVEEELLRRK